MRERRGGWPPIDGIAGTIDDVVDFACEDPVLAGAAVVATGGAAFVFAAPLATTADAVGLRGASGTGTAMTTLHGVARSTLSWPRSVWELWPQMVVVLPTGSEPPAVGAPGRLGGPRPPDLESADRSRRHEFGRE